VGPLCCGALHEAHPSGKHRTEMDDVLIFFIHGEVSMQEAIGFKLRFKFVPKGFASHKLYILVGLESTSSKCKEVILFANLIAESFEFHI
jgi:hypothetical protein